MRFPPDLAGESPKILLVFMPASLHCLIKQMQRIKLSGFYRAEKVRLQQASQQLSCPRRKKKRSQR